MSVDVLNPPFLRPAIDQSVIRQLCWAKARSDRDIEQIQTTSGICAPRKLCIKYNMSILGAPHRAGSSRGDMTLSAYKLKDAHPDPPTLARAS
jgi:hypothetical protein